MTRNKSVVETYMKSFAEGDRETVLSCLTDDVVWDLPGAFHLVGKAAFGKEIRNENFVGDPAINVTRTIEENDIVVAEGTVRTEKKDGGFVNLVFCDVFEMREGKIGRLISYLMEIKG